MTIAELCNLFDRYEVVDTKMQLDREYYSNTNTIYSDGNIKTSIGKDAYVRVSVYDANYVMFVDIENKIYLCVYRYIPTTKFKQIKQELQLLKNEINKLSDNNTNDITNCINDDVIDINAFKCTECKSDEKLIFYRSKDNSDILITKCNICKSEYTFVPSKYYKLASKRTVYFKSNKSSRDIEIKELTSLKNASEVINNLLTQLD